MKHMKKLYFLLAFVTITSLGKAQEEQDFANKKQADIEALKVAFISRDLALTPAEAQQFWPVYNQYSKELAATRIENPDVLEREEKVLNLRKNYKERFTKILGPQRVNNMYNAEGRFHQLLFKAMRKQNQLQTRPNRPFRRNF
jgi:hypothetical protein